MAHERFLRAVLGASAGYLVLFAVWAAWLRPLTIPATVPYQAVCLVGCYGSVVGLAMMWANRPSRADRQLRKHGLEGWARIEDMHRICRTDHATELTELDLELTVPGSETYNGRVLYDVAPIDKPHFAIGEYISIRVDPHDRDRIMLCP
ncbi:hypothetical protein FOS14_20735 [Skermania sp. ID1734]|uniref:hypothetical protein n=1 Tax=Skermania sp. ID1734 TaxID=2597516 RepID=UPI00117EBA6A|nr:hypothetical protein [Skermania sp. ID1734]TSD94446.1 hypothetical protein FOS14_20735 [Skermania sp. ID1734]